jgi:Protein of Unknown function (DUF2784)
MAADLVVVVHLAWILFLIFGAFIGRHFPWVKWLHVAALTFSVLLQTFAWTCPLTMLEVRLREGTSEGYAGDFIAHYAERLVYLQAPREAVFAATILIVALSAWAYWPAKIALNAER